MVAIILVLLGIGSLVLFAYLKILPKFANKKLVSTFNKMVLGVTFLFSLIFYFNARVTLPLSEDFREVVAIAGALGIEIVFLLVAFILRNFWIFKPPKRPGGLR